MKSGLSSLALFVSLLAACGGGTAKVDEPSGTDSGSSSDDTATDDTATSDDAATTDSESEAVGTDAPTSSHVIQYVWVVVMENHNWSSIKGSSSAPYINSLLGKWAHAENYNSPAKNHPSEPNYIWIEAGDNLGITNDNDPSSNHKSSKDHLTTRLQNAGVTWRSYQEDIDGKQCPLTSVNLYAPKHNPMLYFDDVTDSNSPTSANCIEHVRPFPELFTDAAAGKVAHYNFVTPNLCNDMHGQTFGTKCQIGIADMVKKGDTWLAAELPKIMALPEFKAAGAIFLTWDEGEGLINPSDGPIGMIVISPFAKKNYANTIKYTHSSLLRTVQTIFDVKPFIRDAATATDLSDLFETGP